MCITNNEVKKNTNKEKKNLRFYISFICVKNTNNDNDQIIELLLTSDVVGYRASNVKAKVE